MRRRPRRTAISARMNPLLPLSRALGQLNDPVLLGVVARSLLWSVAAFAALHALALWAVHDLLDLHGPFAWLLDVLGAVGTWALSFWLFVPLAVLIGTLYFDRIAAAVERRWYPALPPPAGASLAQQSLDGLAVGLRILLLNLLALLCALLLPGIGLLLGWAIAGYAIGRGLFVAVAMRRMPGHAARALYRHSRLPVLAQGAALALVAYVPVANLLLPVLGIAAMVHLLDLVLLRAGPGAPVGFGA